MKDSYTFYKDQLTGEYKQVFDQVELYVVSTGVDENTREEQMGQLLDMFISAQQEGKPVQKIAGTDVEAFCKAFCSEFSWKNRLYSVLDRAKTIAVCLLVICVFDMLKLGIAILEGQAGNFWTAVSELPVSGYLLALVCAAAVGEASNLLVRRIMFKSKKVSMKALKAITYSVTAVSCVVGVALVLTDKQQMEFPLWAITLCAAGYLVVYQVTNYKRLQAQKREKMRFSDLVGQEMEKETADEMEKKFQRINRRSLRQGKGEITMEAFLDMEEKSCHISKKTEFVYVLLPLLATGIGLLLGDFDGIVDMVVYAAVLLAVEYFFMVGIWRIERRYRDQRQEWIRMKREEIAKMS